MIDRVSDAAARAVRWVRVPDTWAGHRPEPLAAERLWACTVEGDGPRQAGRDADGRVVLVGPADRPPMAWGAPPDWVDIVEHADDGGSVTVHGFGRRGERRATTTLDVDGRPVATAYSGGFPDERYVYDSDGRIVAIDESPGVMELTPPPWREDAAGGRLDVKWDGGSPLAVSRAEDGLVIWERLSVPWPDALRGFAQALTGVAAAALSEAAQKIGVGPRDEVFGLALVTEPAPLGTVKMLLFAGLQAARERILAAPDPDPELVEDYLWGCQDPERDSVVAVVALPEDVDRAALRAAAMHDPRDPRRTLAQAAVPLLAARDWSALFTITPDFAVYVIGEDDDYADLYASMVAGNPPERLQARAARWRGSPYPPSSR